ncbi:MAG: glutamate mutase L [Ardenticatenia bacterium]|nr:glutamate mutase L [Ardenticatenia bacterium]
MMFGDEFVEEETGSESFLYADIGSIWTRAVLVDQVDGRYSFVARGEARTTLEYPAANIVEGVREAVQEVERASSRTLLGGDGESGPQVLLPEDDDGDGVDAFLVTTSAFRPLKAMVFSTELSAEARAALAALHAFYVDVVGTFTVPQKAGGDWGDHSLADLFQTVDRQRPDVVLFVALDKAEPTPSIEHFLEVLNTCNDLYDVRQRPTVVLVGQTTLVSHLAAQIETMNPVEPVSVGEDEAAGAREALVNVMGKLLHERRLARLPGFGALQAWSETPVQPTAVAQARAIELLARQLRRRLVFVDVGGEHSHLVMADADFTYSMVRPGLGLGFQLQELLKRVGAEAIFRWVPGLLPERELEGLLIHRSWYPCVPPATRDALWLEQAAGRAVLQELVAGPFRHLPDSFRGVNGHVTCDYVIGAGGVIQGAPEPSQALLLLLDTLQPTGIVHIMRDRLGLVPALGVLSQTEPEAVADLLAQHILESLGTVVVLSGPFQPGKEVLQFRMIHPDGATYTVTVEGGRIYREYLAPGMRLELELRPARKVDVGLGPGQPVRIHVPGGTVGLVIDARGRPLTWPETLVEQRRQVQEWLFDVGG